jgi:hypothetical protein
MRKITNLTAAILIVVGAVLGAAFVSVPKAKGVIAGATTSPNVTLVTSSFKPSSQTSSVATWTQPPRTIATIFWRIIVTTPGGSCTSLTAVHVGQFEFWLNQTTDAGPISQSADIGPNTSQTFPTVGAHPFGSELLPGKYRLRTEMKDPYVTTPASDCTATTVKTEVYIETVAAA